jgi:hypothetical protein
MTATTCVTRETKTYPDSLLETKEEYLAFREKWRARARDKSLLPREILLRCLLLGKDPWQAMPPTRDPRRIRNGAIYDSGLYLAVKDLKLDLKRMEQVYSRLKSGQPLKEWEGVPHWLAAGWGVDPTRPEEAQLLKKEHFEQVYKKLQALDILKLPEGWARERTPLPPRKKPDWLLQQGLSPAATETGSAASVTEAQEGQCRT